MCHSRMSELCQGLQQAEKKKMAYTLLISRSYLGVKIYWYMQCAENHEPPKKLPSECRVNVIGSGKFFCKFSLSPSFWSIEIMCLGDLVDSWLWPNGFTAVPEARAGARGMPHIKIPYSQRSQYGGRGVQYHLQWGLHWFCFVSFISLQRNTQIEDLMFWFGLVFFVANLSSDSIPTSLEKDPSAWLMPLSLYQLKAAVKHWN